MILKTLTLDKILPQKTLYFHPTVEELFGEWPKTPAKYQPTVEKYPRQADGT